MNRGRISAKRLRYKDALDDMLAARKYDLEQGNEFQAEINEEIEALHSFKVKRDDYVPYNSPLVKFHFFDELDNIQRFEFPKNYPEATELLKLYPAEFIQHVIDGPVDAEALFVAQSTLHQFLCSYDAKTMHLLRRFILYDIHEVMLENDYYGTHQVMFGVQHGTPGTPTPEVIREAVEFIEQRAAG
ncbi:hypothetical protein GQR58_029112 [Nymphon striatum]|nr:hypothetical protein GQR58_029112 [Nymphon striatum]